MRAIPSDVPVSIVAIAFAEYAWGLFVSSYLSQDSGHVMIRMGRF